MQTILFNILDKQVEKIPELDAQLSFDLFINYLKERIQNEHTFKKEFFETILKKFKNSLEENGPVTEYNLTQFSEEFTLIYALLLPPLTEENQTLWALGSPTGQSVFYGTDSFFALLKQSRRKTNEDADLYTNDNQSTETSVLGILYSLILDKLYGLTPFQKYSVTHSVIDADSGLLKYYDINIDTQFVDVQSKEELPILDFKNIREDISKTFNWEMLLTQLPLNKFCFKGFSILTLEDSTSFQVLENIKNIFKKGNNAHSFFDNVILSLKTMVGNPAVEFALLPFVKLNGKIVFDLSAQSYSGILDLLKRRKISEEKLDDLIQQYVDNPELLLFNTGSLSDNFKMAPLLEGLNDINIASYALIPIYHNSQLIGALEVFTGKEEVLDKNILAKLFNATPLLAQLLKDYAVNFEARIDEVIKEKFTSLQPAVQWKFNEKAWEYLKKLAPDQPTPLIENVEFKNVYPLYGAIDIRNSTIERNNASCSDLMVQLEVLEKVLQEIKALLNIAIIDEMIFTCREWLELIIDNTTDNFEAKTSDFLNRDIPEALSYFKNNNAKAASIIKQYETAIEPTNGAAFANRRALESSIKLINMAVNDYLELLNDDVQHLYPCYFEKFRSDGVEYDIYIGQSIAPYKTFDKLYLKNIRLWQLTSMAAIVKITHNLTSQMEKPLETTQLIFINSSPIDISFRIDERRFDVEGSYNIRYQIIKKRIDKVTIKNTNERLTQPGKIALVYFQQKEEKEYKGYISYLQKKNILLNNLEELELEELQGVTGLRALRVGVHLE